MLKKVSTILSLLTFSFSFAFAQTVQRVQIEGSQRPSAQLRMLCTNDAGQVTIQDPQGNPITEPVIYLPFGDSLIIDNENSNVSTDPLTTTTPGIGYLFYDCSPSVSGPAYSDLIADSCLNMQDSIFLNGQWEQRLDAFWATRGNTPDGDMTFINDGTLQTAFNGGDYVQFFFAPATFNYFDSLRYEADQVTGETGPCLNVGVNEAFSVVYLNELSITNLQNNRSGLTCIGSFNLEGGLPEAIPGERYTITIINTTDPNLQGIVENASVASGDSIRFYVPESGTYTITVTDAAGSQTQTSVDMTACTPVVFSMPFINAEPSDAICLPITVENFTDVGVMQFDIQWDPTVLDFDNILNIDPILAGSNLNASSFIIDTNSGTLNLSWPFPFALPDGITLPDSTVIFDLCFNVIGNFGTNSPVRFIESTNINETIGNDDPSPLGYTFNSGQVNVSSAALFSDISVQNISCNPGNIGPSNDGAITITVAQGTAPYNLQVTYPNGSTITPTLQEGMPLSVTGLEAGTYMINITDNSNPVNQIDTTIEITEPDEFVVQFDETNPTCFNEPNGSIKADVLVNGFLVPDPESSFNFAWSYSAIDSSLIDSVVGGISISLTVTDQNGCMETGSTTLSNPRPIELNPVITPAQCSGQSNGSIDLTLIKVSYNGTFDLSWRTLPSDLGVTTVNKPNLLPGTYYVTLTDQIGCMQTDSFTVGTLKTLSINTSVTDALCNGDSNGSILASGVSLPASGESLPYTFTWSGPAGSETASDNVSSTFSNLIAGTYTVDMTDGSNCSTSLDIEVAEPSELDITLLERIDETCNDTDNDGIPGQDGLARVTGTGGTAPYSYLWTREINRQDTMYTDTVSMDSVAMNLSLAIYTVFITDANGCMDSLDVTINAPAAPQITSLENDSLQCFGDQNGTLTVNAVNGNGNIISYEWDNGAFGPSITNLSAGIYRVRILADDGCLTVDSALVYAPTPVLIDSIVSEQPRCPGSANGSLAVFASGGTTPYLFIWEDTPLNDTTLNSLYPGLSAGTYEVTVTDANNCASVNQTATLVDPPSIELTFDPASILPVSCFEGSSDGQANVQVSYSDGSTGLFIINWQSGEFAQNVDQLLATNLSAGFNVVTAIDANNCSGTDSVEIPSPPAIELSLTTENVTCNGAADGNAEVMAMGGTPPFQYNWPQTGSANPVNPNLAPGTYVVQVIDDRNCVKEDSVSITEPDLLIATIDLALTNDPLCNGDMNGQIAISVNTEDNINPLGNMPYTWSNGAPADSSIANGLAAGQYGVTVTDINGCTDQLTYTLSEPTPVQATVSNPPDPQCFGEATFFTVTTASGGIGMDPMDYTFQVDRNGLNFPLGQTASVFAGAHIITVSDPNGCIFEDSIFVNQPEEINVVFSPNIISVELGDSMTTLNPIVTSSLPLAEIVWTPTEFLSASDILTPIVQPLENTQYALTITDVNGCTASASIIVELDRNRNVFVPNAITPNGDGRNDEFRIFACTGVRQITSARIFDRWGGIVFEQLDVNPVCEGGLVLWDGEINGDEAPIGTYVYIIQVEFIDGVTLTYRGDVNVLR